MSSNGPDPVQHHSRFGGTWVDRSDFELQLSQQIRRGALDPWLVAGLRQFERDGYLILEGAASEADLDRFETAISSAFRDGHQHLIAQLPGSGAPRRVKAGMDRRNVRIVDSFAVIPEALALLSTPKLAEFMRAVLQEKPMLFQSISFDMGSEQGLHQDTAYVVVDRPMELVACWIALEDVQAGSGELQYMVGSHRLPDFDFGGDKKHWDAAVDGPEKHEAWFQWIHDEGQRRGLPVRKFAAKRGDILVWHADLAHGGTPITRHELTRKSLVGHYCPASAVPYFMRVSPNRSTVLHNAQICYSSWYYDLAALASQEQRAAFLQNLFEEPAP